MFRKSPAIEGIEPYKVPRHGAPMDLLLDGIGGLPAPADLFRCLDAADPDQVVRHYPDTGPLVQRLATRHGIAPDRIIVTSGGDDALDRACRSLLTAGRSMVMPTPTFEMIARYTQWAGGELREVPWAGGPFPTDAVLAATDETTAAIAVVSPNNPTGAVATRHDLQRLAEGAPDAVLLVDLAYVEFADDDPSELVASLPNAIGFRTLSKAWGLAGLRVGYAFGPAELIGWMRSAGNPYTVSGPSVAVASHRLDQARPEVDAYVRRVRAQRDGLTELLAGLGTAPLRSQANFVFTRTAHAASIRDGLAGLGIGVRTWPGHDRLGDAVRINVPGDEAVLQRLTHGLQTVLAPQAILLDMDGVIAEVSGSYRTAIVQTAATYGVEVTGADIAAAKAAGDANNDWVLTRRLLAAKGVDAALAEVTARFEALYQGTDGKPGLKATERLLLPRAAFEALAARLPVGIVTGRPRADAAWFLETHGVADLVTTLVAMEDAPAKPDPAPVRLALQRLGVQRAWLVGDTPDDVRAARAAAVVPIGVPLPGEPVDAPVLTEAGAARILPDVTHLLELLP